MDLQQSVPAVSADLKMFQGIQQISPGQVLPVDQRMDDIVHLLRLGAAEGVKLPLSDQKNGDTFRQIGILAHLVRRPADADDCHQGAVMKDGQVDTLLGSGKLAVRICLQHFSFFSGLFSDFMKTSDSLFICAGIDDACMVNKIYILSAHVFYGRYDLLRQFFINRIVHRRFPLSC